MSPRLSARQTQQDALARQKAEVIMKVRGGVLTAAEAARQLGVSRKTYYKWEQRALSAMLQGLCERNSGRPASAPDEEKAELRKQVETLERKLRLKEQSETLRELLRTETEKGGPNRRV